MPFTIAIVGRPNVGKSTLFNRLAGKRLALVDDQPGLTRDRREADAELGRSAVRLIDLGLFRIGGEKYAELDHHYGATTLEKRHVTVTRDAMTFDYAAKEGKRRAITVTDQVVLPTVRALARSDNGLDTLFSYQHDGTNARMVGRTTSRVIPGLRR